MDLPNDDIRTMIYMVNDIRKRTGITLRQLAKDIRISEPRLSELLNYRRIPQSEYCATAYRLREYLKKVKSPCPEVVRET